ncbi:glycine--tRNA ligase subunit beta [Idiomarina loihiensis]|uniref:glycine--tRNA ligase subunit beta n=1 Tax=Idiomarina loihiensis TaxID=135577 RepID=UPI001306695E|nr:glycine--tRNA ligase subunit beta [Idiomarina loihiensis]MRJ44308.1 glycine--tRNA ligase subunit beta [Idiomarina loihiensis]UTW32652.1 glycine--tRNA ligase subunit beta [Idiomarina loihiensis]
MQKENLLIELGTEELPPKALKSLRDSLKSGIESGLKNAELSFDSIEAYATPRRLAVLVKQVETEQQDKEVEKRGPAINVAFDDTGKPTKAAEGWARSNGITVEQADRLKTDKGEWLLHKATVKGQALSVLVQGILEAAIKALPIPKPMRWGDSTAQFIRPVHTLTVMLGSELIDAEILETKSARFIQGHRFHSPQGFELDHVDNYLFKLREAKVIANFEERIETIQSEVSRLASELGGQVIQDDELVEEVAALVEWPVALTASFDQGFLAVPKEPLIVTMKDDQRYFPVEDGKGNLLPQFIFITNIESRDPQQVIKGNEKVVRPRLADAQFFFESDKKVTLESRVAALDSVLFQKQLGSIGDKARRISVLAGKIANQLTADVKASERAGLLCKADLVSDMVSEFPETQGVMGKHYALNDGESPVVAEAIEQHYWPRFSGDELPLTKEACAVALADKLDTLVGIFGIGQVPKGDRDPFALRRAALGLLRTLVERKLSLDLHELLAASVEGFGDKLSNNTVATDVFDFLLGRFRPWYQDQGITVDVIQSVLARSPSKPTDFDQRVKAVQSFKSMDSAASLAAANKRVGNILAKSDEEISGNVDEALLQDESETTLYRLVKQTEGAVKPLIADGKYSDALTHLSELKEPVDAFFEHVMVNADDDKVRINRLNLLFRLRQLFLEIADISLLQ